MSSTPNYYRLSLPEWIAVKKKTEVIWKKEYLGNRPKRKDVKLDDGYSIDIIKASAFVLLFFIIFFTGFKAMLSAVPVASAMYDHLLHSDVQSVLTPSKELFTVVMQLMFFVMTELGLIYFMLLAQDIKIPKPDKWHGYLSITWVASILPTIAVYGIVLFVVQVSSGAGEASVLDKYLPIIIGMGLAVFVEGEIKTLKERGMRITTLLTQRVNEWERKNAYMLEDKDYLLTLYENMWDAILHIQRTDPNTKKKVAVNAWLERTEADTKHTILLAEYKRNTTNMRFVVDVRDIHDEDKKELIADSVHRATDTGELDSDSGKRVPPNGMKEWTVDTLYADLQTIGLVLPVPDNITRQYYANGYSARTVMRELNKTVKQ